MVQVDLAIVLMQFFVVLAVLVALCEIPTMCYNHNKSFRTFCRKFSVSYCRLAKLVF